MRIKHILLTGILCIVTYTDTFATPLKNNKLTQQLLSSAEPQNMWRNLTILSNFPDRSAKSLNGLKSSKWIKQQIQNMVTQSHRNDVTIYTIPTRWLDVAHNVTEYPQSSIMLKIGTRNLPGIVIGAHMDTVDCQAPDCAQKATLQRPGADDDGSGTVTLLEIARVLLNNQTPLNKPVYLIWYAAEETDLDGSKSVVHYFKQSGIPVAAVMQLDMTGFALNNDMTVWLTDSGHYKHVDKKLTALTYQLAQKYLPHRVAMTHLDDESDHWSWHEAGYKTVFPMESHCHGNKKECPYREHTLHDTMDKLSLKHMTDYLMLGLAFVGELA
jgi:leucyl aminopeptidase